MSALSVVLILTVIAAVASLAGLVWYYRPRFSPVLDELPVATLTQYDLTILEHGDPAAVEFDMRAPAWPE